MPLSNDDFTPMTNRLRTTLLNRQKTVNGEYVFPGRHGGHKTIQNNRALEAAFGRAGFTDVSSHNMRKTFATRLLSRGAAITDVQHLLGHASVKTTERAYDEFVKMAAQCILRISARTVRQSLWRSHLP